MYVVAYNNPVAFNDPMGTSQFSNTIEACNRREDLMNKALRGSPLCEQEQIELQEAEFACKSGIAEKGRDLGKKAIPPSAGDIKKGALKFLIDFFNSAGKVPKRNPF